MKTFISSGIVIVIGIAVIALYGIPSHDTPRQQQATKSPVQQDSRTPEEIDWHERGLKCALSVGYPEPLPPWVCEGGLLIGDVFVRNEESTAQIVRDVKQAHKTLEEKFGLRCPFEDMSRTMTPVGAYKTYVIGCDDKKIYFVRKIKATGQFQAAWANPDKSSDRWDWR